MDVHLAPVAAKRMWGYLRAVFFMMRKGVLSKRKLLVGMHLVMKRRNKAVARSVANLLSHHAHGDHAHALRHREYEFSCSGSPNASSTRRRPLVNFPCLGADDHQVDDHVPVPALHWIECYAAAAASLTPSSPGLLMQELALTPREEVEEEEYEGTPARSPLIPSSSGALRVSDFSSEEVGGCLG